jgi:hypothetical protein
MPVVHNLNARLVNLQDELTPSPDTPMPQGLDSIRGNTEMVEMESAFAIRVSGLFQFNSKLFAYEPSPPVRRRSRVEI